MKLTAVLPNNILKTCLLFLPLVIGSLHLNAQQIKGRIIDAKNGQPIAGAHVFINNTLSTTLSLNDGSFSLPLAGIGTIIVACKGYHTFKEKTNSSINHTLEIQLQKKETEKVSVYVGPPSTLSLWQSQFKLNFLGRTQAAYQCSILNMQDVYFFKNHTDSNLIEARSEAPLIIFNKWLGYKITFFLERYWYQKNTRAASYFGYVYFESIKENKKILKNRRNSYYGSAHHFYRTLVEGTLSKKEFSIKHIQTDSSNKINNGYASLTTGMNAEDIFFKSPATNLSYITWKQQLQVTYLKAPKIYLSNHAMSLSIPHTTQSVLTKDAAQIWLDDSGTVLNPTNLYTDGYWSIYKLANHLPYHYTPDK